MFSSWKARKIFLLIILFVLATGTFVVGQEEKPEPGKSVLVMMPMRDGVRLATQVQIPEGKKKRMPVMLIRTPYGRTFGGGGLDLFRSFIGSKYILVSQDTRGRFDSEGENQPFLTDQEDGYDTVEWIASQPWSNGKICMVGASALGITAYQAAITRPQHLDCVVSVVAPANLQTQAILWGGQLRKDLGIGWLVGSNFEIDPLILMTDHVFYDDFVKKYDLTYNAESVEVPMLHIGGWFDIFTEGTIAAFNALQENGGEGARGRQRLIMGPWTHAGEISRTQGELEFPENSLITPMISSLLNWIGRGIDGELTEIEMPVQYYLMGDTGETDPRWNVWKKSSAWPPPEVKDQIWNLTPGKALSESSPEDSGTFTYTFDPSNPVPTVGGGNLTIKTHGSKDQRQVEDRPDVLVFDSPVFDNPYAIAGDVNAELTVSTTGCDTDFTAKLTDVYPDGRSMLIADGIFRVRLRDADKGVLAPAVKDEKMRIKIYIGDTAYVFNKGHKMRLAISSSNHPRFSVNTNICGERAFPADFLKAEYVAFKNKDESAMHEGIDFEVVENSVYAGGADGSVLIVPVLSLE